MASTETQAAASGDGAAEGAIAVENPATGEIIGHIPALMAGRRD
jgi:hypothetical protein